MHKMIKAFNTQSEHWGESLHYNSIVQQNEYNLP